MERKIAKQLAKWKENPSRMPLILLGARQVGKTHTLLTFGKTHYKNTVYVNMEDSAETTSIFDRDLQPERIIAELAVKTGQTILADDTLIILDEIQACERALTSLKYFQENAPKFHIVCAGNLLGVAVNREKYSFPVGKVNMMTLHPMDFEEFLLALGQEAMISSIRKAHAGHKPFSLHETAMDLYRLFQVVGGMPRALLEYLEKKDFNFVLAAQKTINDAYIADMAKYASVHETTRIMATYNSIPAQLAKENRKFQYKLIRTGARAHVYETPVEWLKAAGILIKCDKVREGIIPLPAQVDAGIFKLYIPDAGILFARLGIRAERILSPGGDLGGYIGALTENFVATALTAMGRVPVYWESQGRAEIDFLIQDDKDRVIPIEVKAAENVRSKSLQMYVAKYGPPYSIRISGRQAGFENGILSVPLYAVFCLGDEGALEATGEFH